MRRFWRRLGARGLTGPAASSLVGGSLTPGKLLPLCCELEPAYGKLEPAYGELEPAHGEPESAYSEL